MVAVDRQMFGQLVDKSHVTGLKLHGSVFLYAFHHCRYVYRSKLHLVRSVVHSVERGDVLKQRCEPLCLCIAALQELLAGRFVDAWVVEYGLEVALYARHGGLQLVCNVLCELAFQYVLLVTCALQTFVYLHYLLGNLA